MAFEVETGTGSATANSYLSIADADSYHTDRGNAGWTGTDPDKEFALIRASQYIDALYGGRWVGEKVAVDNAMDWPRTSAEVEGFILGSTDMPQRLKDAVAEAALRSTPIGADELTPDVSNPAHVTETKNKVGPIEQVLKYGGAGASQLKRYTLVGRLLRPLVLSTRTRVRG